MKLLKYFSIGMIFFLFGCEEADIEISKFDSDVLFISTRFENRPGWNLMKMNENGDLQTKITELTVRCTRPVISHSGGNILFVHLTDDGEYELYSVDTDGTNQTLIDSAERYCGSASWSFNDSKIVYSKNRNAGTDKKDIILYDISSESKHTLTNSGNNYSAVFTSNNKIMYCHSTNTQSCGIYIMDMEGNNKQKLISNACNPVLSPNGAQIAYHSTIDDGSTQIFIANKDGKNQKQLTSSTSPRTWPGWPPDGNHDPNWTPNGKRIVYVSWGDGDPEIHIMDSDGTNKNKLTNTDKRDENPFVTKNGKYILFSSSRNIDMNSEIYIMDIYGNNQRSLTNYKYSDNFPVEIK